MGLQEGRREEGSQGRKWGGRLGGTKQLICSPLAPYHWLVPVTLHVLGNIDSKAPFVGLGEMQKGILGRLNGEQGLNPRWEGTGGGLGKR